MYLKGVVDENFDTVVDFQGWNKDIQIFPEGNVIVTVRFSGGDGEQEYIRFQNNHYKNNETTIQVKNNVFASEFEALYDVVQEKFISDKFTFIGPFVKHTKDSEEKFAKAIMRLPYDDNAQNVCEVFCYIGETGKIRTPLYNSHLGRLIDTTADEFSFSQTIEAIKIQMAEDTSKKAVTTKKIRRDHFI